MDSIRLVDMAFDIFNQQMDTDYSRENVEVKLITAKTADKEIAEFLMRYPEACEEQMLESGYYREIKAEAFVTPKRYGIIVRTDIPDQGLQWRHVILHEISHIYCITHELPDGENFFRKYCLDYAESSFEDGMINGGYAIWREFIAEYMARRLDIDMVATTLKQNEKHMNLILEDIENGAPDVKECIEAVLIDTMASKDILKAKDKPAAFDKFDRYEKLKSISWQGLLNTVYAQLYDESRAVYEIDLEFIKSLGSNYLSLRTETMMKLVGGGTDEDSSKKAMSILMGMNG